jgi:hypothetical protein
LAHGAKLSFFILYLSEFVEFVSSAVFRFNQNERGHSALEDFLPPSSETFDSAGSKLKRRQTK